MRHQWHKPCKIEQNTEPQPISISTLSTSSCYSPGYCGSGNALIGHTPTEDEFQINLEYGDGFTVTVEQYNDNNGQGTTGLNWGDPEQYAFAFSASGKDVWEALPDYSNYTVIDTANWTISGWFHTPFYGSWTDNDTSGDLSDGDYLAMEGYHSFPGDGDANLNEVWDTATLSSEILGYTYRFDGTNAWLEVDIADNSSSSGGGDSSKGCVYNPNSGIDTLLLLLLACGIFYGRRNFLTQD